MAEAHFFFQVAFAWSLGWWFPRRIDDFPSRYFSLIISTIFYFIFILFFFSTINFLVFLHSSLLNRFHLHPYTSIIFNLPSHHSHNLPTSTDHLFTPFHQFLSTPIPRIISYTTWSSLYTRKLIQNPLKTQSTLLSRIFQQAYYWISSNFHHTLILHTMRLT